MTKLKELAVIPELREALVNLKLNLDLLSRQAEKSKAIIQMVDELCSQIDRNCLHEEQELARVRIEIENRLERLKGCLGEISFEDLSEVLKNLLEVAGEKQLRTSARKKILLVEDDPLTSRLISHFLQDPQVDLLAFSEAEAALDYLKDHQPDLILLDLILPGLDGFQFLKKIKTEEKTKNIPVLIMSSISGEKEILQALQMGASDYITKPFSPRIVQAKIRHYLNVT